MTQPTISQLQQDGRSSGAVAPSDPAIQLSTELELYPEESTLYMYVALEVVRSPSLLSLARDSRGSRTVMVVWLRRVASLVVVSLPSST